MTPPLGNKHHWALCVAALAVWIALGWPFLQELIAGTARRGVAVPPLWLAPFALFGAAAAGSIALKLRAGLQWALLWVQFAAVLAMTIVQPSSVMSVFLIIIAWQVAMVTIPLKALAWVVFQTAAIIGTLAQAPNPNFSYILALSVVLQLSFVLTAHAFRREAEAARALAQANGELQAAQAIIATTVRDAERLRISRELHDDWGHELTALGLQLEIASHLSHPGGATDQLMQAKGLARDLLAKVRDAVAALRGPYHSDWKGTKVAGKADPSNLLLGRDGSAGGHSDRDGAAYMPYYFGNRHRWTSCVAALAVWITLGWPVVGTFMAGASIRGVPVSALWFIPFTFFGAAALAAMSLKLQASHFWALICVQVAAIAAMAFIASWAMMSSFLIIVAWQVGMATGLAKALSSVVVQTLALTSVLAVAPNPDLCWVIFKSLALQLFVTFVAQALRRQSKTARALSQTNRELRAAQAIIANTARNSERLRISRELHDAWAHELTALGLQLEIASHVTVPSRASDHVMKAKGLARELLAKVRDVVAALREAQGCDLRSALEALAQSIPTPAVHVEIAPDVRVSPDQAHALMRCAQEAVTNAVKHAQASNLWLQVMIEREGVRLLARDDGETHATDPAPGSGLLGMRERVESLGGRLAVRTGEFGFAVDAWIPSRTPQLA